MLKKSPLKRGNSKLEKSPMKKDFSPIKKSLLSKSGGGLKKSGRIKARVKSEKELIEEQLLRNKRTAFFSQCDDLLPNRSEISGKRIPMQNRATRHHCYLKSLFPEIEFSFRGILTCTFDEHAKLHGDLECFSIAKERRIWMKEHWDELIQESKNWEKNWEKTNLVVC